MNTLNHLSKKHRAVHGSGELIETLEWGVPFEILAGLIERGEI